ncbi:hypothetical protein C8J56DRAFT_886827 [Mycena floridula]|nr:hypothetical protein C8J56DRAFT_886827 [Mycena floridula]
MLRTRILVVFWMVLEGWSVPSATGIFCGSQQWSFEGVGALSCISLAIDYLLQLLYRHQHSVQSGGLLMQLGQKASATNDDRRVTPVGSVSAMTGANVYAPNAQLTGLMGPSSVALGSRVSYYALGSTMSHPMIGQLFQVGWVFSPSLVEELNNSETEREAYRRPSTQPSMMLPEVAIKKRSRALSNIEAGPSSEIVDLTQSSETVPATPRLTKRSATGGVWKSPDHRALR